MPQMYQVLRECEIGMLTAGMSTRAAAREELNVHFTTISCLQRHFREFGSTSNRPHNRVPRVWRCVGERVADVNIVNRVPHGGGRVMVWAGISYRQRTQLYFINGNLNAQRHRGEILSPIVVPFIHRHHLMFQHDNALPHVAKICTLFLEAANDPILPWPAYSPDMSPIEHVWDAMDRHVRQRVPVPTNMQQLCTAIEEEWGNIPQATINSLINSMRRRCVALHGANGSHARY